MARFEAEEFNDLRDMFAGVSKEAVLAAEDAAAKVFLNAARAAAPLETAGNPFGKYRDVTPKHLGQLKESIKIVKTKDKTVLSTEIGDTNILRIFVGPEKKKGYYGFFVEKGHKTAGPHRIKRSSSGNTHSQSGVTAQRQIPAKPWFEPAIQSADSAATSAAESAFNTKLNELNGRK